MGTHSKNEVSNTKITIASCISAFILFALIVYGWRLFGFKYCEDPSNIRIESIEVNDGYCILSGEIVDSSSLYVENIQRTEGNTIYVGLKYKKLSLTTKRVGSFKIRVNGLSDEVYRISLKGNGYVRLIYPVGQCGMDLPNGMLWD